MEVRRCLLLSIVVQYTPFRAEPRELSLSDTKSLDSLDGAFASSALSGSLSLLVELTDLWRDLPSATEALEPAREFSRMLVQKCGKEMHDSVRLLAEALGNDKGGDAKGAIVRERVKPKILRQYEPDLDVG